MSHRPSITRLHRQVYLQPHPSPPPPTMELLNPVSPEPKPLPSSGVAAEEEEEGIAETRRTTRAVVHERR